MVTYVIKQSKYDKFKTRSYLKTEKIHFLKIKTKRISFAKLKFFKLK